MPTATSSTSSKAKAAIADAVTAGALCLLLTVTAAASEGVRGIVDPLTVDLEHGPARLAGLLVPAETRAAAHAAVETLLRGQSVVVEPAQPPRDRHGRRLAQVTRADGLWVQGELLRRGLAVVRTLPEARSRASEMLAMEAAARRQRRGLWGSMPVWPAAEVTPEGFRIVEGTVARAARVRGTVYLNFAADWKSDFTVAVKDLTLFKAAGTDPQALSGKRLRVRGWVRAYNGPFMEADHPEQIEVLDAVSDGSGASR